MSYSSMVEIKYVQNTASILEVIQVLLDYGWSFNDHGTITYLGVGDVDSFDWKTSALDSWPEIRGILANKHARGESPAIILTWQDTNVGGEFHFAPNNQDIWIGWSVNRKTLEGGFTDHSWYLSRILPPLVENGIGIESFRCTDTT